MNNNQPKIKAVLYCRVSSKEQEETGYSLPAQEKLLKDYAGAGKKNLTIARLFSISESASGVKQRKVFGEMMEFTKKNKVKVIICEKVDRITRNLKEAVGMKDWLDEDEEREIHLVKDSLIFHKNSRSQEKLNWNIRVVFAQNYIDNLSEEVKKGQAEKIAQGWLPTKPPIGYKTIGDKGHKTHVIDDKDEKGNIIGNAAHIKLMFEQYATGNYSIARLEKELYERGMRTRVSEKVIDGKKIRKGGGKLGMSRIHVLLSEPFYHGKIRWLNDLYAGKHEPLITKDLFDKVQTILRRQIKNPHFTKHNSLFKSKIQCEHCGGMLTWYIKKGHWYGHCNNHGEYARCTKKTCIRQERVEEQYMDVFSIIAPKSEEVLVEIENILREEHSQYIGQREKEVVRINGLLDAARKQKDKYYEAKINREAPLEYCERKITECTKEEEALEATLMRTGDKNDEFLQLGLAVHELARKSKEIYEKAAVDEKRLLLSQIFTNLIQDELKIKTKYTLAAEFLVKWIPKLNESYEPSKTLATKGEEVVFVTSSPIWLPGLDSNQGNPR